MPASYIPQRLIHFQLPAGYVGCFLGNSSCCGNSYTYPIHISRKITQNQWHLFSFWDNTPTPKLFSPLVNSVRDSSSASPPWLVSHHEVLQDWPLEKTVAGDMENDIELFPECLGLGKVIHTLLPALLGPCVIFCHYFQPEYWGFLCILFPPEMALECLVRTGVGLSGFSIRQCLRMIFSSRFLVCPDHSHFFAPLHNANAFSTSFCNFLSLGACRWQTRFIFSIEIPS